jgi:hypothetical protein
MDNKKYDVFISYSRKDYVDERGVEIANSEVAKILETLKQSNISFWFDKKGVRHGEDFGEAILKYIKASKIFVYLSTVEANRSEWTRNEIACALMYKKKIIPVRIDESPFHDSVMFRIAALDHINYYLNPKKGREELIDSIKRYLAEEEAAAARREEEERRRREEQDLQRRQQEVLRIKQQQAEILRDEISKTEEECSVLEKDLLRKKHDVEVVNAELNSKLKHLDEQKQKMNAILHDEDDNFHVNASSPVATFVQAEDIGFQFQWLHPLNSLREMWHKMKETADKRHWTVTLILAGVTVLLFADFFVASFEFIGKAIPIYILLGLNFYTLMQLILNNRSGILFLLMSPFLVLFLSFFNYLYYQSLPDFKDYGESKDIYAFVYLLPIASVCISIVALLILSFRKRGKSAWTLLQGKATYALHINQYPLYYLFFLIMLLIPCINLFTYLNLSFKLFK